MDFTGKPLKGFIYVSPKAAATKRQLDEWLALAVANAESLPAKAVKKTKAKKKAAARG
jgi:hypothetical protein